MCVREMAARSAGFAAVKTLEGVDLGFAAGAPEKQIREPAGLASWSASRTSCRSGRRARAEARIATASDHLAIPRGMRARFTAAVPAPSTSCRRPR